MRVAVGGFHFHYAVAHFENRDIECAAAEVEYGDGFVLFLVESVCKRGRCRLIDNALYFESGDLACVFGRLPLSVVEISGNRDYRRSDLFAEVCFGGFLELGQDHCRHFGGRLFLSKYFHACVAIVAGNYLVGNQLHFLRNFVIAPSHKALDGVNGVFRVGYRLPLCDLAHQSFSGLCEAHDRRSRAATFLIWNYNWLSVFHNGNNGVRCSKVNTYNFAHAKISLLEFAPWKRPRLVQLHY